MKNKKAEVPWMVVVGAIIALLVLGATIYFIWNGTSSYNKNLQTFQDCKSRNGHCEASESGCKSTETAFYGALGCKDQYCCLPPPT